MLGWLYGKIANARNSLYEKGIFESFSLGAPVISVGNITMGGTGKTPLVAYVAEVCDRVARTNVCIISRGYGRKNPGKRVLVSDNKVLLTGPENAGDEPYELAQKLLNKAIVISDADRVSAAKWAMETFGANVFVLDDAFQHRRVKRDLDIVCIDATRPFRLLREPLENLARADAIVITRANLAEDIDWLRSRIAEYNPASPIFTVKNRTSRLIEMTGPNVETRRLFIKTPEEMSGKKALAFCALGNPENFFEQLRRERFDIVAVKAFRDHHKYGQRDIAGLEKAAKESGAEIMLTTMKDYVKLGALHFEIPCLVVESELVFDDEEGFRALIYDLLSGGPFLSPQ
jgi:tetraacyldisaccharide 4'-kinase